METFEKVYIHDNYAETFARFRDRYSERAKQALRGRKVDTAPTPNATTVIYLNNDPSGDVTIAGTGDFVAFFNRRYGNDRIGAAQRALANAARKAEEAEKRGVSLQNPKKKVAQKGISVRSVRPRFAFAQTVFAMLLVLSFTLLGVTSALLDNTDAALSEVRTEVVALETVNDDLTVALAEKNGGSTGSSAGDYTDTDLSQISLKGEDSVEIYPAQSGSIPISALLNALADLWK